MTPVTESSFSLPAKAPVGSLPAKSPVGSLPAKSPVGLAQSLSWAGMTLPLVACAAIWGIGDAAAANAAWLTILHSVVGTAASAWTVLRIVLRRRAPPRPAAAPPTWTSASLPLLYALLVIQPLLAAAGSMLHGSSATLFAIPLPTLLPTDPPWADRIDQLHGWNALLLLALIAAHIASAVTAVRQPLASEKGGAQQRAS